ncbi:MAG TPA: cupin domain-containing protein [Myxococcota bacterium]|nr:cupin domain-containing protein [Myxococcota bacterium]
MSRGDRRVVDLVERLGLVPHPEGGYYREVWRSPLVLPGAALPTGQGRDRRLMTSIYYLLPQGERSRLHRVRSEELWLHHQGDDLLLGVGATREAAAERERFLRLGPGADATFQAIVPAGHWQQAEPAPGAHGYVLVGCVVAPGFEFEDFELADDD